MGITLSRETEDRLKEVLKEQKVFASQGGFVLPTLPSAGANTIFYGISNAMAVSASTYSVASSTVSFDSHVPNDETEAAIREARAGIGLIRTKNRDDLFRKLNE
jgi:hypothetical protein